MCIFDEDNTAASQALCSYIADKHNIAELENDTDAILDSLYYWDTDYVLTIKEGYSESLENGETQNLFDVRYVHDSYENELMDNALNQYVRTVSAYIVSGESAQNAALSAQKAMDIEIETRIEDFTDNKTTPSSSKLGFFFQYLPYIFLSVMMNALTPVLLIFRKEDIKNRIDCSSLSASKQMSQLIAASLLLVAAVWIIFMIAGMLFNNGELYSGRMWFSVLNCLLFILFSAGLALFVSLLSPSASAVNMISIVIGLGMSFLCGVFIPQNLLDEKVLAAARFLPAYWYVKANNMLWGIADGVFNKEQILICLGMLLLFTVVIFLFALVLSKAQHDKGD